MVRRRRNRLRSGDLRAPDDRFGGPSWGPNVGGSDGAAAPLDELPGLTAFASGLLGPGLLQARPSRNSR